MASTGLLGVNPYKGGNVAVDFSSKPTQYAIQEIQHQQAKAEALEKYYKDWEKSLNTAGIGEQERRMFAEKLNEIKGFAIKNKEQINNPSKYGYDAQSTLESGFKELQSFLEGSKQKTAEVKAYKTYTGQQYAQGKYIDGDIEVMRDASLPYGAGYIAPDSARIQIYDQHDPIKYKDQLRNVTQNAGDKPTDYSTITLPGNKEEKYFIKHYPDLNELKEISRGSLTKIGAQKYADYILNDAAEVARLGKIYKERTNEEMPKNREGVFLAHTIAEAPVANKPAGGSKTKAYEEYMFNRAEAGRNTRASKFGGGENQGNLFDSILDMTFPSGKVKNGTALDNLGNPYNGTVYVKKELLPAEIFSAVGPTASRVKGFNVKFENGLPVKFVNEKTGTITRQGMENYQLKYNTEPMKGRQLRFGKVNDGFKDVPPGGFN
jgi:hypothetical protein